MEDLLRQPELPRNLQAGVRILDVAPASAKCSRGWLDALRRGKDQFDRRLAQWLTSLLLRQGVALRERDPQAFARYIARWRERYSDLDKPPASMIADIEAEAVPAGGPGATYDRPPVPAEWFAPKSGRWRGFVFYVHGGSFIAERSPRITALVARF